MRVRALKPGNTEVKVFVLGLEPATVAVRVTSEEITELKADPSPVQVAVNDHQPLTVYGKALTSGLQEMFPQPDLKIASRKTDTVDVIGGEDVYGKAAARTRSRRLRTN